MIPGISDKGFLEQQGTVYYSDYFISNGIGYFLNRTELIAAREPALELRKLLNF